MQIAYSNDPFLIKECSAPAPTYFEYSSVNNFIQVSNTVFFAYENKIKDRELWETNGTSQGTHLVKDFVSGVASSNPDNFTLAGKIIYFTVTDPVLGMSLWGWK